MPRFDRLRSIADALLDTVFPARCVSCHGAAYGESPYPHLCSACATRVHVVGDPRCLTCGYPFFGLAESHGNCQQCEHLNPAFESNLSLSVFRGPTRELIHALKYRSGMWTLEDIRALCEASTLIRGFVGDSVLVPVPLHRRKLRQRGYNQSELIAREIVTICPKSKMDSILQRVIDTPSQTQFNRMERRRNLKNAFSLCRNRAIDPELRYIVIDDVFTTGSTINACAAVLRRAGARNLFGLTIGHG